MSKPTNYLSCAVATIIISIGGASLHADVVVIESRSGGLNYTDYSDLDFANSSLKSSAAGCTAGIGSRYGFNGACTVDLSPTVAVSGGSYLLQTTHGSASSVSPDIMVNVSISGGVFTNAGQTNSSVWTTAFQQTPANAWNTIGTILLNAGTTAFTITCSTTNTDLNSSTNRFYSDAYRLTYTGNPCLQGLPELYVVDGPLYAGQTNVTVAGVSAQATNINVYTNGTLIGSLHTGIVAGPNVVTVTPLLKGTIVTATQTGTNGVESCDSSQGTSVGGGANPQIRVSLSLETDSSLTGPIGAAGTSTSGNYFFDDATGNAGLGGFGTAPAGGTVIFPSTNWQTVTFMPGVDSGYYWAGSVAGSTTLQGGQFAQLDAIAFCIDDLTDTGPFAIYIDDILNGTNVIQNFDNISAGTTSAQFLPPGSSATTSPDLLAQAPGVISPNISVVDNLTSTSGANSCFVSWQFNGLSDVNWVRLSFDGTGGGATALPQVDVTQTISFNMLLLPVGAQLAIAQPALNYAVSNLSLTLNWSGTFYLQSTTNLATGSWSDVGVTTAPYNTSITNASSMFFRLSHSP